MERGSDNFYSNLNLFEHSGFSVASWAGEIEGRARIEGGVPINISEITECSWVWRESALEKEPRFRIIFDFLKVEREAICRKHEGSNGSKVLLVSKGGCHCEQRCIGMLNDRRIGRIEGRKFDCGA